MKSRDNVITYIARYKNTGSIEIWIKYKQTQRMKEHRNVNRSTNRCREKETNIDRDRSIAGFPSTLVPGERNRDKDTKTHS